MNIGKHETYDLIRLIDYNQSIQYKKKGPFSSDYVAGFYIGLSVVSYVENSFFSLELLKNKEIFELSVGNEKKHLRSFIIGHSSIDKIFSYKPSTDYYGWMIKDTFKPYLNKYYFLMFKSEDFVNGFITIFDFFNKDFRYYILGRPFKYDNENIIKYDINGYDIEEYYDILGTPSPVYPYYTGVDESDFLGIDYQ